MHSIIDRLRGLLALGVALGHLIDVASNSGIKSDSYWFLLAPWRQYLGFNCVVGFIVLSGYCIARSTMSRPFSLSRYAWLRVTRIFPTLITCCILAGVVELAISSASTRPSVWVSGVDLPHFLASITGLAGFLGQYGSFAPSYTVSWELLYYALWGIVLTMLRRHDHAALVTLVAGSLLFCIAPPSMLMSLVLLPAWLVGVTLAIYQDNIVRVACKVQPAALWFALFIAYTTAASYGLPTTNLGWETCAYFTSLATFFAFILASHLGRESKRLRFDSWMGDISYPLFLVHGPVMILTATLLRALTGPLPGGLFCALLLAASFGLAQAVLVLVERPVMALRDRRRAVESLRAAEPFDNDSS